MELFTLPILPSYNQLISLCAVYLYKLGKQRGQEAQLKIDGVDSQSLFVWSPGPIVYG